MKIRLAADTFDIEVDKGGERSFELDLTDEDLTAAGLEAYVMFHDATGYRVVAMPIAVSPEKLATGTVTEAISLQLPEVSHYMITKVISSSTPVPLAKGVIYCSQIPARPVLT